MRIVLFSSQPNVLHYARVFATLDHSFTIVTLVPMQNRARYERIISQFEHIESPNVSFSPIFLRSPNEALSNLLNPCILLRDFAAIFRTLNKLKPHAVIGMYIVHAYPLALLRRLLGFTLFVMVSGADLELTRGFLWRATRKFVCARSRAIFAVGNRLARELNEETGLVASVFPTGANPDFFRPLEDLFLREKYGYDQEDIITLALSFLIPRKCLDDLIVAFGMLSKAHPRLKLIIAGEGPERAKLKQLTIQLRLEDSVSFLGSVDKKTKLELFNISDIYVIPSHHEGLPFSLMEAMSCGCVCIASNVGDIPIAVEDGVNGFLITPHQPEALARKIDHVIRLPREKLLSVRKNARQTILDRYDFDKTTRAMIDAVTIYRSHSKNDLL
jgi:glycosyltransferase involved in cell wall biosynthesis